MNWLPATQRYQRQNTPIECGEEVIELHFKFFDNLPQQNI